MQQRKCMYLKHLLDRRNEYVGKYVKMMRLLELKARECYDGYIEFGPNDFIEMLLLDSCFIAELLRKYKFAYQKENNDIIFQYKQVFNQVRRDLVLVENQVSFFVVDQLFYMTRTENSEDYILDLVELFIDGIYPWLNTFKMTETISMDMVDHLVKLVHTIWGSSVVSVYVN
ncbi:UNVERIFIED_CONTAM: hypothetical protein Slati_2300200, partial [Sesamum latifolium]